jgi:hypothetical protein
MRKITKRSAAITAATVIAIGGGAAAWAAANGWDITGTGTGDASAATITPLTASSDMGSVKVYPGLVATVAATVNNPNDFPVKLNTTDVTPTGVVITGGQNATNCQNALLGAPATLKASFPGGAVVPKKASANVASNVTVASTLPQDCSGSHIKVTYTFTGVSTA